MAVNLLTDWRLALKEILHDTFPAARIYNGERPSKLSRDQMAICVFVPTMTEWSPDANMAQPEMTIRIWCAKPRNQQDSPPDPAPIEQAIMDLAAALQAVLATLGAGPDFFKVVSIVPDYLDEYGLEANLVGWTRSPMMIGG